MNIFCFGYTSPSGDWFLKHAYKHSSSFTIYKVARSKASASEEYCVYCDLSDPYSFDTSILYSDLNIFVSFAPLPLFANFLKTILAINPALKDRIFFVVAVSTSSVVTKRFSFSLSDKKLYSEYSNAELLIEQLCTTSLISSALIRPTMIYNTASPLPDKNISFLKGCIKILPCLPLPSHDGYRQPIHALQLAQLVHSYCHKALFDNHPKAYPIVQVGGDEVLRYCDLLHKISSSSFSVIRVPNRLWFLFVSIVSVFSPKYFSALLRVSVDLCGFEKVGDLLSLSRQSFPFHPVDDDI